MSQSKPTAENPHVEPRAYDSNWEHLCDEMLRLDLLLEIQLRGQPRVSDDHPLQRFKGLVVTPEEIAPLLASAADGTADQDFDASARDLSADLAAMDATIQQRLQLSHQQHRHLELPFFARLFALNRIEQACILTALAPEIDRKYEKLYAYIQDDVTRKRPTVDLVLSLACRSQAERIAARSIFAAGASLVKYRVLEIGATPDGSLPLLARPLNLDDRIVDQLLGKRHLDQQLEPLVQLAAPRPTHSCGPTESKVIERLHQFVRHFFASSEEAKPNVLVHLRGPHAADKRSVAAAIAHKLGLALLTCDARLALADNAAENVFTRVAREAVLQPAVLCIEHFDQLLAEQATQPLLLKSALESMVVLSRLTFLLGDQSWMIPDALAERATFVAVNLPAPGYDERVQIWQSCLPEGDAGQRIDLGALASKFRFGGAQIRSSVEAAADHARWRNPQQPQLAEQDLYAACRAQSSPALSTLARKVEPVATWDDLILPDDQIEQLNEICNQARQRHVVLGQWGFERKLSYGKGISALFSGPPGTGKTMAAEIVAGELDLELFKIDLSRVVSKYIGETEKNLDRIFTAAEQANAILFFDEADALFGKRSEVRDSHDRYANLEISYLLQKMEEYEGMSMLASNLRKNLDEAFMRRLQFVVSFPFPDASYRQRIWQQTFPSATPRSDDIDFGLLANCLKVAGGNIKNIVLNAAHLAAANGGEVGMRHIVHAARRELTKIGRGAQSLILVPPDEQ